MQQEVYPTKMEERQKRFDEILDEWDKKRNRDPKKYSAGSNKKVWWICQKNPCGCHKWVASIANRTRLCGNGCPYCSNKKLCPHNNLLATCPEICKEWNYERNINPPEKYSPLSNKKVWWFCQKENICNHHLWQASINNRTGKNKIGCPYCSNRKLCSHNNLLTTYPEICKEWNYEKNTNPPEKYSPNSGKSVWWKCVKENICKCHTWKVAINNRINNKTGCPYCANRKLCSHNNLLAIYPELCKEWDKKNLYPPEKYPPGSQKKVWWSCQKENICNHHRWRASISSRTCKNKNGCPYCSNRKLCPHNNLLITHPVLCEEWDKKNLLSPEKYSFGSHDKVWWICKNNPDHKWKTNINARTSSSSGCPICKSSKGESIISTYLTLHDIEFIHQKKFDGCVSKSFLPFDFYLPSHNILIEFDGIQHFKNVGYFYSQGETLKYRIHKDKLKLKFCLENKITLLRIAYEEINIVNFILDVVIHNRLDDLFLFDLKNKLSEKTNRHYINQYEEICADNNIPLYYE